MGYFIVFKTMQYQAKKEIKSIIKNNLNSAELIKLKFDRKSISGIVWKEKGKEFIFNKTLYDVVKTTVLGDEIIFECINDKKEQQLFSNLDEQVTLHVINNKPVKNDCSKQSLKNILKISFLNQFSYSFKNSISIVKFNFPEKLSLQDSNSAVFIPPPEFL